jgi:Bacterial protein of unknown function (DUF885)
MPIVTTETGFKSLAPDNRPAPRTAFDHALRELLDDLFEAQPTWATQVGFHAYDDRWPDMTQAGHAARLVLSGQHRRQFEALREDELTVDERIDRGLVLETLDALDFDEGTLREANWDPLTIVRIAGGGLFSLLAREFAPWEHRGAAFVGRLKGLPKMLDDAADELKGTADRPVSALHTQVALAQLGGVDRSGPGRGGSSVRGIRPHPDRQGHVRR